MQRLNLRDERGASAVIFALLLVPLIGFSALAVDLAAVYSERRQLQNGADAAALAIGHDCASGDCGVTQATADELTEANYDEAGSEHGVPVVTVGDSEVTVVNPGVQRHWLAPVIGHDESDVSASATVRWGAPGSGTAVLPLAFSWCAFDAQAVGGTPSGAGVVIKSTKTDGTTCTGPSDLVVPGGFGWLDTDGGECESTSGVDEIVYSDPGASVPADCSPQYFVDLIGDTVLIPIFDESGGTGASAWYEIYAYAAFTVTGYDFGAPAYQYGPKACGLTGKGLGEVRCSSGSFIEYVDSSDDFEYDPDAPDLGARVVELVS
jgi:Putative Flp pilus-assembly TadE/G-like